MSQKGKINISKIRKNNPKKQLPRTKIPKRKSIKNTTKYLSKDLNNPLIKFFYSFNYI